MLPRPSAEQTARGLLQSVEVPVGGAPGKAGLGVQMAAGEKTLKRGRGLSPMDMRSRGGWGGGVDSVAAWERS